MKYTAVDARLAVRLRDSLKAANSIKVADLLKTSIQERIKEAAEIGFTNISFDLFIQDFCRHDRIKEDYHPFSESAVGHILKDYILELGYDITGGRIEWE